MRRRTFAILRLFGAAAALGPAAGGFGMEALPGWQPAWAERRAEGILRRVDRAVRGGPFRDDWDSLRNFQTPEWFQDAKFGIFIHWGPYAVPAFANEWYPRNMYQKGSPEFLHHARTFGPHTQFGYKDFLPRFRGERFDPAAWISLFRQAGARYVVPVAEHHDGFAMYDSDLSRWTAVRRGPRRDVVGELAREARRAGLFFGVSSHRAEHWWFLNGGREFPSDVQDPAFADLYGPAAGDGTEPDEAFLRDWLARSAELVDKYHPLLVYFDWWIGEKAAFDPYLRKFAAYHYNRAAGRGEEALLQTKDKAFVPGTAVRDVERGTVEGIQREPWQTCTSVSWSSWCYVEGDRVKDAPLLLRALVDAASKNGNFLLSVGPRPDGVIPEDQARVLREMGAWLSDHGEAVYGTRPFVVHGEGPTEEAAGKGGESEIRYRPGDVRYTRKGDSLFAIALVPPGGPLTLTALGKAAQPALRVREARVLPSGEEVPFRRSAGALVLSPPPAPAGGDLPVVYRLRLEGSALGGLEVESAGEEVAAWAVLQNYGAEPLEREAALLVDGRKTASGPVRVEAFSSTVVRLAHAPGRPGVFTAALQVEGHPSLSGSAALPVLDLSGEWRFQRGDDPSWKSPDLDDSHWERVVLPAAWEDHSGYVEDRVFGWYRRTVRIPAEWKGRNLRMPLGKIDDADAVYVNGVEVGRTGSFPPAFATAWEAPRLYRVPASAVRFGADNVVAVRVYDETGGGGLYAGPLGPLRPE